PCERCRAAPEGATPETHPAEPPRDIQLPARPDRYNAAMTYVDAHRDSRADAIAIRCQGKTVTYGEYAANVDRAGNALRSLGLDIEDRVVILCLDSPGFVYAFFGAIKIGAIPV